jgi:hypothetical protein
MSEERDRDVLTTSGTYPRPLVIIKCIYNVYTFNFYDSMWSQNKLCTMGVIRGAINTDFVLFPV